MRGNFGAELMDNCMLIIRIRESNVNLQARPDEDRTGNDPYEAIEHDDRTLSTSPRHSSTWARSID